MKKTALLLTTLLLLICTSQVAARRYNFKARKLRNHTDSLSYAVGVIRAMAGSAQTIPVEGLKKQLARKSYKEHLKGGRWPAMCELTSELFLSRNIVNREDTYLANYRKEATQFLERNAREGDVNSDNTIQFKVVKRWGEPIKQTDRVTIHYFVSNVKGMILRSGYEKDVRLDQLFNVIDFPYSNDLGSLAHTIFHNYTPGKHGTSYTFYVPQYLWLSGVEPYMVLIYEVEIYPTEPKQDD